MNKPSAGLRPLDVQLAELTAVGGRPSNQDALGSVERADLACFVVADGAGGYEGGEIASSVVVQSVCEGFDERTVFAPATLEHWMGQAVEAVAAAKEGNEHLHSMSATAAIVLVDKAHGQAMWSHLGDTRIYLFRGGRLQHMSSDHSLAQQLIDAGLGGGRDARSHPKRNLLYAAIGAGGDTEPPVQPPLPLLPGDVILICTDGLWEWVTEAEMEQTLAVAADAEQWLAALCTEAERRSAGSSSARDNYTAQVLWMVAV